MFAVHCGLGGPRRRGIPISYRLKHNVDRHGPEEQFMTIEYVPFGRALAMVKNGDIQDGKTIIGLLLVATIANSYI